MLSSFFSVLLYILTSEAQTTTTTCQNDPKIYKLDIRDYLSKLDIGSTLADIDPQILCSQIYEYDYIWLTQMWTPSRFNYQNTVQAEMTGDYIITQTIKEYVLDPSLGTSSQFVQFQQQLKSVCYHIKFLGEFSFYIGQDSPLVYNRTRFLQRPYGQQSQTNDPRYDNEGFVWAVNDKGQQLPFTVAWNLFTKASIQDINDIIYRQILLQYNLDGIVFLQPSLGLYSFNLKFYQPEVTFFGQSQYMQDFYLNFGLKFTDTKYYFMGGEDNLNYDLLFSNMGLQQTFKTRSINNYVWQNVNYTFDPTLHSAALSTDGISLNAPNYQVKWNFGLVTQSLSDTQKTCFKINITKFGFPSVGLGSINKMASNGYYSSHYSWNHGEYAIFSQNYIAKSDDSSMLWTRIGFNINPNDQIEAQYDPITKILKFIKYGTKIQFSFYIQAAPSTLRFMAGVYYANEEVQISFPFYFSAQYKSINANLQGQRNLLAVTSNSQLQYAQIEPSINQFNSTRLMIWIQNIPADSQIGVGLCDRDLVNFNKHTGNIQQLRQGAYLIFQNGIIQHSDSNTDNNQQSNFTFTSNSLIQISYNPDTNEVSFFDNNSQNFSMLMTRKIKNLNFCVAFNKLSSSFSLQY